jgi:hypothetical protein
MITEDRKFLDLDHVCDQIVSQDDRAMFDEAIRCYQIGSHRAAVILVWCVTADCLYRRIDELAKEGDGVAQEAGRVLQNVMGQACYEENLIVQAKKCELFDDYEEKCLRFARDTRSKCAHPTGVIPSAEAVRNIFYVCSQTVLCRDGYRGMSFVKQFVHSKLDDMHLLTDKNRAQEACRYYFGKVPERIWPQFAACSVDHVRSGASLQWKQNAFCFFKELIGNAPDELALKISQKFQPIESIDRTLFSIFVGIDKRGDLWDGHSRSQAKAHLRDVLKTGKIDSYEFDSYGNLCSLCDFEAEDKDLFEDRFSLIAEHISKHPVLIDRRRSEVLSLIIEAMKDDRHRQQIFKGVRWLVSGNLFMQESDEIVQFVDEFIESDWREESVSNLFLICSDWSDILKVYLLKKSERLFEECSEDFPDDLVQIFDAANSLIFSNSFMLPSEFEVAIKRVIDGDHRVVWFDEKGSAYREFVGQIDLIRTQHGIHFPVLSTLDLPKIQPGELGEDE